MKKMIFIVACLIAEANAQLAVPLTLEAAYENAIQNYPLVKQRDLIKQTTGLSIENINKGYLPQFNISAQASYQSAVTSISIPLPGITIQPPSKDQYKLVAEVNQLIYDGGLMNEQKKIQTLSEKLEEEKINVELYKLYERINQLFLGILLLEEQIRQIDLVQNDIQTGINKVTAQVNNGVSFKSNLNVLKAEYLKNEQRLIELQSNKNGLLDMLGLFINQSLPPTTKLERPSMLLFAENPSIQRPELNLFSYQQNLISGQEKIIQAKNLPKAGWFLQGGYGRPGLNFLKNEFAFFYTTGLRINWSLSGLYTQKREQQQLNINKKIVELQKETFLLNTNSQLLQVKAEMLKWKQLIEKDKEIIQLRENIKAAAQSQLDNGVITANDFLREVNAADLARQSLIIHEMQGLQAQINYKTVAGINK